MSRAAPVVLAVLALALPAAAVAKGPGGMDAGVTVCGAQGCATAAAEDPTDLGVFLAGDRTGPPSSGARFYQVTLPMRLPAADGEGALWEVLYVPSRGLLRTVDTHGAPIWLALPAGARAAYDGLVRGKEPFPPGALPDVRDTAPADPRGGAPGWLFALAAAGALAAVIAAGAVLRRRGRPGLATAPPA